MEGNPPLGGLAGAEVVRRAIGGVPLVSLAIPGHTTSSLLNPDGTPAPGVRPREVAPCVPVDRGDVRWTTSSSVAGCQHCGVRFTLMQRKHHCRGCGAVVCGECTPYKHRDMARLCRACNALRRGSVLARGRADAPSFLEAIAAGEMAEVERRLQWKQAVNAVGGVSGVTPLHVAVSVRGNALHRAIVERCGCAGTRAASLRDAPPPPADVAAILGAAAVNRPLPPGASPGAAVGVVPRAASAADGGGSGSLPPLPLNLAVPTRQLPASVPRGAGTSPAKSRAPSLPGFDLDASGPAGAAAVEASEAAATLLYAKWGAGATAEAGLEVEAEDDERAVALVKLLLRYGAGVNVATHTGVTPLHAAAAWGTPSMVRALLDGGALQARTDGNKLTAYDYATLRATLGSANGAAGAAIAAMLDRKYATGAAAAHADRLHVAGGSRAAAARRAAWRLPPLPRCRTRLAEIPDAELATLLATPLAAAVTGVDTAALGLPEGGEGGEGGPSDEAASQSRAESLPMPPKAQLLEMGLAALDAAAQALQANLMAVRNGYERWMNERAWTWAYPTPGGVHRRCVELGLLPVVSWHEVGWRRESQLTGKVWKLGHPPDADGDVAPAIAAHYTRINPASTFNVTLPIRADAALRARYAAMLAASGGGGAGIGSGSIFEYEGDEEEEEYGGEGDEESSVEGAGAGGGAAVGGRYATGGGHTGDDQASATEDSDGNVEVGSRGDAVSLGAAAEADDVGTYLPPPRRGAHRAAAVAVAH